MKLRFHLFNNEFKLASKQPEKCQHRNGLQCHPYPAEGCSYHLNNEKGISQDIPFPVYLHVDMLADLNGTINIDSQISQQHCQCSP